MIRYDFSPFNRSFVGFDRMASLIDAAIANASVPNNYPPYNIVQESEGAYRIELAVSGFSDDQITLETHENVLTITANSTQNPEEDVDFLHRGIAQRSFEKRFQLADHVEVTNAELEQGLLTISLKRELPDALKPRKIAINKKDGQKLMSRKGSKTLKAA